MKNRKSDIRSYSFLIDSFKDWFVEMEIMPLINNGCYFEVVQYKNCGKRFAIITYVDIGYIENSKEETELIIRKTGIKF